MLKDSSFESSTKIEAHNMNIMQQITFHFQYVICHCLIINYKTVLCCTSSLVIISQAFVSSITIFWAGAQEAFFFTLLLKLNPQYLSLLIFPFLAATTAPSHTMLMICPFSCLLDLYSFYYPI